MPQRAEAFARRHPTWIVALILFAVTVIAYFNSLRTPFLFDDLSAIVGNPSITDITNLEQIFWPTHKDNGTGAFGRPIINLTFAINYAIGGLDVEGYHVANLLIHAGAAMLLFGVARRLLLRPPLAERFGHAALPLAAVIALLWVVHPLQTESITCVVQRTESLVGFFYLATLYSFLRSVDSDRPRRWQVVAVVSCLLGMGTKEVMVTAPVLLFLLDRTFVSGTFAAAWKRHRWMHLATAATWVFLAILVARGGGHRGEGAGFGYGLSVWQYLLTQCKAIALYLKLCFWPHPLILDYGAGFASTISEVLPQACLVVLLLGGTVWALRYRPALGFAGAWFFGVLAPSSSFVPLPGQTVAEHRMYLSLAVVVAVVVLALARWTGRRATIIAAALALPLLILTIARNSDYATERRIWEDTVAKCPQNPRAHGSLGRVFYIVGDYETALTHELRSLELEWRSYETNYNVGLAYLALKKLPEAITYFRTALRLRPDETPARMKLGIALLKAGQPTEARGYLESVAKEYPELAEVWDTLGFTWLEEGQPDKAFAPIEEALRLNPDYAAAHGNLGVALFRTGRVKEAIKHYQRSLELDDSSADVHFNYGVALAASGWPNQAEKQYAEAVRLDPDHEDALVNLGISLAQQGRVQDAVPHLEHAVEIAPDRADAHANLGIALGESGRLEEAASHLQRALALKPDYPTAHYSLGNVLLRMGEVAQAKASYAEALRLDPGFEPAAEMLERMQRAP